jgi:ribosome biogenesis GTPase
VPWHIDHVAPRWSEISRLDPTSFSHDYSTAQVLAANVDLVLITAPLDRALSANRLERETVVAWDGGARPVVVLTKADRHADPDAAVAELSGRLPGVEVLATAALDGVGVEDVRCLLLPDQTALLLGASGAGKSTLTNALLGAETMATGGVRRLDQRGKHTTTVRHLLPVPGGGVLIDSPGVRSLGLAGVTEGLAVAFADVDAVALGCRFSDCAHSGEPGCAIAAACADGSLDERRVRSWQKLAREIAAQQRRGDAKATAAYRRAEKQRWKQISKLARGRARP